MQTMHVYTNYALIFMQTMRIYANYALTFMQTMRIYANYALIYPHIVFCIRLRSGLLEHNVLPGPQSQIVKK